MEEVRRPKKERKKKVRGSDKVRKRVADSGMTGFVMLVWRSGSNSWMCNLKEKKNIYPVFVSVILYFLVRPLQLTCIQQSFTAWRSSAF